MDGGSPDIVAAMAAGDVVPRLSGASRDRLLSSARTWYANGAADELRRRTGACGPVRTAAGRRVPLRRRGVAGRPHRTSGARRNPAIRRPPGRLEETGGGVLATVLDTYTEHEHPLLESVGLRLRTHPDPRVRRRVPYTGLQLDLIRALLGPAEDSDPLARHAAAEQLASSPDRSAAVADALAALTGEENQWTRLEAAYGLAPRDDPRAAEAIERVGHLGEGYEHDHRAGALWTWQWDRKKPSPA
ncbi:MULTISPECIES: hypothetical protein [unclassified Streptomyces]|uniref:hypothetical protein n=1 Tax=unclassified Streptomyces TaxID=2593676 RepID=UPI0003A0CD27|nr:MULTISPECIES: hypothetical protein [unclassified Streptomyces]MYY04573.1 hypothetical protein [Streptomyces sp. SID4913]